MLKVLKNSVVFWRVAVGVSHDDSFQHRGKGRSVKRGLIGLVKERDAGHFSFLFSWESGVAVL
jgi:hypothetical protein